jgi:Fe-Mn family superoxide dismutase
MESVRPYKLPDLGYGYGDLAPHMSEEQLTIHHQKHHQAYVTGANAILGKFDAARKEGADFDVKSILKELSFNIGGHLLHSLYWGNLAPEGKGGGNPDGPIAEAIDREFGGFERFKKEFTQCAASVEGSGWAALTYCKLTNRPLLMQIEKHNVHVYPMFRILMVLDVFEHAYYIDYKNARPAFIEAFWNIVNWNEVNKRLQDLLK